MRDDRERLLDIQEAIQRHYGVGASVVEHWLAQDRRAAAPRPSTAEDLTAAGAASPVSFVNQTIL